MNTQQMSGNARGAPGAEGPAPVLLGVTTIALGLWMTVAHAVLGYPISDPRTDAFLNEALAGMVAALLGLSSLIARGRLRRIPVIAAMTGLWTMVAPAVVGYGSAVPAAQANGLTGGAMLILLASVIGVGRFRVHVSRTLFDRPEAH